MDPYLKAAPLAVGLLADMAQALRSLKTSPAIGIFLILRNKPVLFKRPGPKFTANRVCGLCFQLRHLSVRC